MKATRKQTSATRPPPAKEIARQSNEFRRRLALLAQSWRGEAASMELAGANFSDSGVCALHQCASALDRLLDRKAVTA